jgi:hypothetical protein
MQRVVKSSAPTIAPFGLFPALLISGIRTFVVENAVCVVRACQRMLVQVGLHDYSDDFSEVW